MPCNRVMLCSLSVAALASSTILLMDDVELGRSGLGDDIGSSAAGAMASCALEGAMLDEQNQGNCKAQNDRNRIGHELSVRGQRVVDRPVVDGKNWSTR